MHAHSICCCRFIGRIRRESLFERMDVFGFLVSELLAFVSQKTAAQLSSFSVPFS